MDDFCAEHGIQRKHFFRARPQQNGVAECANRTMEQGIISMLHQAGLPLSFCGEALAAFIHVWNKTPTSAVAGKTPHKTFYGTKPDVSMLNVWGCVAYVHIQNDKRAGAVLGPTWRSVSLLAIHLTSRAGRFITLPPKSWLSQKELSLMSTTSLAASIFYMSHSSHPSAPH